MHQWVLFRLQTPFQPLKFYPHSAGILNNPTTNNAQDMKEDERPCGLILFSTTVVNVLMSSQGPSCRRPISSSRLFTLEAFKTPKQSASSKRGKRRVSARPFEFVVDDMGVDESETDSLDDFIVSDGEEDHKPHRGKKKHAKRKVVLSDDEYDDVIIPAAKRGVKPKASVGEMNEGEISTKMQVRVSLPRDVSNVHPVSEDDGRVDRVEDVKSRPEGISHI